MLTDAEARKTRDIWYQLAQSHLQLAEAQYQAGGYDFAIFHAYHAYECALCADHVQRVLEIDALGRLLCGTPGHLRACLKTDQASLAPSGRRQRCRVREEANAAVAHAAMARRQPARLPLGVGVDPPEGVAEPVEEPAPAPLAARDAVHAVEEGHLLGQEQPRPAAVGDQLHRRQRGRRADLPGGQRVGEDDPLVGHDVEEERVVAPRRAPDEAGAPALEAADAEV
jgi:hypothetical protein